MEPCRQADRVLTRFQALANRNGNLGCSARVLPLRYDLLRIGLHGRTEPLVDEAFYNIMKLHRACTHMDVAR